MLGQGHFSKTLFWYVFLNLLRVFGLAAGVIAGIMSFGGLLKPLMDNGLNLPQVVKMLGYAMPAMTTYSYPIAALFACTVVYGRLSSDNEVTAFRAAGISLGPLGLGLPALILGVLVSIASLVALSFVVPAASLGMERTVVSNLGQLVVNRIAKSHQIQLYQAGSSPLTIYARDASLEPPDPDRPGEQVVSMENVSIVTFDKAADKRLAVPDQFYMAKRARAYIRQSADLAEDANPVQLTCVMSDGLKFPRQTQGANLKENALQGGIQTTQFGPFPLQSPLRENTKFMDIRKLRELLVHPEKSRRMQQSLQELIRQDQQTEYLKGLLSQIVRGSGFVQFTTVGGDKYTLIPSAVAPTLDRTRLALASPAGGPEAVKLIQTRGENLPSLEWTCRQATVRAYPDNERDEVSVSIELTDATLRYENQESARTSLERDLTVAMPAPVAAVSQRTVKAYIDKKDTLPANSRRVLYRNLLKQDNSVRSEMHSRASFAISCVVLTLVGYGLGVMFKSGNYLNAFAVSVVPAILSIVLVVTGQHICENIPPDIGPKFKDPLNLGLTVIWTGNLIVLALAIGLMTKLRRT